MGLLTVGLGFLLCAAAPAAPAAGATRTWDAGGPDAQLDHRRQLARFDKTFNVSPKSRLNVDTGPGTLVPELIDERFGALIVSDQPIAVETCDVFERWRSGVGGRHECDRDGIAVRRAARAR